MKSRGGWMLGRESQAVSVRVSEAVKWREKIGARKPGRSEGKTGVFEKFKGAIAKISPTLG